MIFEKTASLSHLLPPAEKPERKFSPRGGSRKDGCENILRFPRVPIGLPSKGLPFSSFRFFL
jgi:hypothetical protein